MICPYCMHEKTKVVGTVKNLEVKRFRRCEKCGRTFPTVESIEFDAYWGEYLKETQGKEKDAKKSS